MAEGEGVEIGILVQQVKEFEIRRRAVRSDGQSAGDCGDQKPEDQQDRGGAAACARNGRADGSFGFLGHPVAEEQREAGEAGREIVFLARGKAEEEKDDGGPAEEEQQDGFCGPADASDTWQAEAYLRQRLRKKRTPRQKPQENQTVEKKNRDRVVIYRIALPKIAKELFVDEIKPEKAFGLAGRRIAQRGEDVPGSGNQKKDEGAGEEMHLQHVAQVARQKKKDKHDRAGEDYTDESFGEDAKRYDRGDPPAGEKRGLFGLPTIEEEIESDADPESDRYIGDKYACKEIGPDCSEQDYRGPKAGLRHQETPAEKIEKEGEREDAEMEGEACAPGVDTKYLDAKGDSPVRERGLLEITDIVLVEGNPVMADENFAPGICVGSVDIVLERRGEEAWAENSQPEKREDYERGPGALSERAKHSD